MTLNFQASGLGFLPNVALSTPSRASGVMLNQSSIEGDSLQPQTVLNRDGMNCYLASLVSRYPSSEWDVQHWEVNSAGIIPTLNLSSKGRTGLFISYADKKDVSSSQIPFSTMLCLLAARKPWKIGFLGLHLLFKIKAFSFAFLWFDGWYLKEIWMTE